jgi:hypothetical protein
VNTRNGSLVLVVVLALAGILWWWMGLSGRENGAPAGGTPISAADSKPERSSDASVAPRDDVKSAVSEPAAAPVERAPADGQLALLGRCVDDAGNPVADVEVSWTALRSEDELLHPRSWTAVDWNSIDAATLTTRTDAGGNFRFEAAPPLSDERASAVWLTAFGYDGDLRLLKSPVSGVAPHDLGAITLKSAQGPEFEVVDSNGLPAADATVEFRGTYPFESPSADADEVLARRIFTRRVSVGSDGRLTGFAFPWSVGVRAVKGEQRSGYWRTPKLRTDRRKFVLGSSFKARGTLSLPSSGLDGSRIYIHCDGTDGRLFDAITQVEIAPDGSWGPIDIPRAPNFLRYRFSSEGGGVFVEYVELEPPPEGGELFVELNAQSGAAVRYRFVDEAQQPIVGVRVAAFFGTAGQWTPKTGFSGLDGIARIEGCARGSAFLSVNAAGYVPMQTSAVLDDAYLAEVHTLTLQRAGTIKGRVTHGGKPVESFDILYWRSDVSNFQPKSFSDRKDGTFEIDTAPLGEIWIFASGHPLGQCVPVPLTVTSEAPAQVELELPVPSLARGKVVDSATLEPVKGAKVQLWARWGSQLMTRLGPHVLTDPSGDFELEGVVPDNTSFMVEADGYGMVIQTLTGEVVESVVRMVDVPLVKKIGFTLQMRSPVETDFTSYTLETRMQDWNPTPQNFDAAGRVQLSAVTAGRISCFISGKNGAFLMSHVFPVVGRDHVEFVDLDPSTTLAVKARRENGERLPDGTEAVLSYRAPNGQMWDSYAARDGDDTWRFPTVPVRNASLSLLDSLGVLHAQSVQLASGANELEIEAPSEPCKLRVVDVNGRPAAAATVVLHSASDPNWSPSLTTDSEGNATAPRCAFDDVVATVWCSTIGAAPSVPVRMPKSPAEVAEVVVDADCSLELALVDGATPMPLMKLFMWDPWRSFAMGDFIVDSRGTATLPRLAKGRYHIVFDHPGIWRKVAEFDIDAKRAKVTIDLRRTGDLEFVVTKPGGSPAAGRALELKSTEFGERVDAWLTAGRVSSPQGAARTDSEGRFVVRGLPHGEYRWSCGSSKGVVRVPPRALARETVQLDE